MVFYCGCWVYYLTFSTLPYYQLCSKWELVNDNVTYKTTLDVGEPVMIGWPCLLGSFYNPYWVELGWWDVGLLPDVGLQPGVRPLWMLVLSQAHLGPLACRHRPCHSASTTQHSILKVKQHWVWSVLGWETASAPHHFVIFVWEVVWFLRGLVSLDRFHWWCGSLWEKMASFWPCGFHWVVLDAVLDSKGQIGSRKETKLNLM